MPDKQLEEAQGESGLWTGRARLWHPVTNVGQAGRSAVRVDSGIGCSNQNILIGLDY